MADILEQGDHWFVQGLRTGARELDSIVLILVL